MSKWLCGLPLFLLLSLGGLVALVWWLWRLWAREDEQAAPPSIELTTVRDSDEEAKAVTATEEIELDLGVQDLDAQAPDLDVDLPDVDIKAPDPDTDLPDVDMPAPALTTEEPATDGERLEGSIELPAETLDIEADVAEIEPQDLKVIEGIGPKYESVLNQAGILRFAQLAGTSVDRLTEILMAEDPRYARLADPTTWPEQAALAAAGDWDALDTLKEQMRAGRRSGMA